MSGLGELVCVHDSEATDVVIPKLVVESKQETVGNEDGS